MEQTATCFQLNTNQINPTQVYPQISLPPEMFNKAFPFHLAFNRQLEIVQAGDVLQRVTPKPLLGSPLQEHFTINRPNIAVDFDAIVKQPRSLFILESLHNKMQLKGQMIYVEEQEIVFFLCSLWVTDTATLKGFGVKLKDFAIHDPIVDFLFLLQARNTALEDARKLTEELTEQQGKLQQALEIQEDLTKTAEIQAQKLEKALNELQETQLQLIQTEKMSSLGQLVGGVAHEINNPVNFIYANLSHVSEYTQQLLTLIDLYQQHYPEPKLPIQAWSEEIDLQFIIEDLPPILASMNVGAERIRNIVLTLRNFSRLDEAEMKRVNIHEGIDSTLLLLQPALNGKHNCPGIEVIKDYGKLPSVECYAGQLNQVFMNILSNAIYILHKRDIYALPETIKKYPSTIKIETQLLEANWVRISIKDNGLGMMEAVRSNIFDPFFTTKPVGSGTGLGLSLSYQIIVEKHGGQLRCISDLGAGAEFQIEIPIQQQEVRVCG
ncbi:MAG TPA: histidine kinase [Cyanobacteria bacterium UBA11372]|nr:histidine kinase [Cyanobacteria bacterium UBA11372]